APPVGRDLAGHREGAAYLCRNSLRQGRHPRGARRRDGSRHFAATRPDDLRQAEASPDRDLSKLPSRERAARKGRAGSVGRRAQGRPQRRSVRSRRRKRNPSRRLRRGRAPARARQQRRSPLGRVVQSDEDQGGGTETAGSRSPHPAGSPSSSRPQRNEFAEGRCNTMSTATKKATKPLYAAIGAGTTALEKARELPQRVTTLPGTLKSYNEKIDLRELPKQIQSLGTSVPDRAGKLVDRSRKLTDR